VTVLPVPTQPGRTMTASQIPKAGYSRALLRAHVGDSIGAWHRDSRHNAAQHLRLQRWFADLPELHQEVNYNRSKYKKPEPPSANSLDDNPAACAVLEQLHRGFLGQPGRQRSAFRVWGLGYACGRRGGEP
jgi:hypothetical protein